MAGNLILSRLAENRLENIAEDVQVHLCPVGRQDLRESELYEYGLFAVKFLHSSVKCLDVPHAGLVSAVHAAYRSLQHTRDHVTLSEPCFLLKVLYHIFMKLSKGDELSECLAVATYILEEVGGCPGSDKSVGNIVTGVCQTLWNKATKLESAQESQSVAALQARHAALKFMMLQKRPIDAITDKIFIALVRFEQVSTKNKKFDSSEETRLLRSTCEDLCNLLTDQYDAAANSIVLLRLQQFKYLWGRGELVDAEKAANSLLTICDKSTSTHTNVAFNLCKTCIHVSHMKQHIHEPKQTMKLRNSVAGLSEVLKEYEDEVATLEESSGDTVSEEFAALVVLLVSSLGEDIKSMLNKPWPDSGSHDDSLTVLASVLRVQARYHRAWCSGDMSRVQKMWARRLQPDNTLSLVYLLQLQCLYTLTHRQRGQDEARSDWVRDVVTLFEEHLEEMKAGQTLDKYGLFDKHWLGTMVRKFGNLCHNRGQNESAVRFYTAACKHHTEWCRHDPAKFSQKLQEVNLWHCYDSLAESHRRLCQYQDALTVLTDWVSVDTSHLTSAAKLWVRVKKDLYKQGQLTSELLHLSLMESVLQKKIALEDHEKTAILKAEVLVYKTYRSVCKFQEAELRFLGDLQRLTKDDQQRAALLVEEAKLLWLHPALSDRCSKECVKEAVKALSSVTPITPTVVATSAEAHLWLYITRADELAKQSYERVKASSRPGEESDSVDEHGEERPAVKTKLRCQSVTLQGEVWLSKLLDKAIFLWGQCISDNCVRDGIDSEPVCRSLHLTATIYWSIGKPLKALEALHLLDKFLSQASRTGLSPLMQMCCVRLWLEIDVSTETGSLLETWTDPSDMNYCLLKAHHAFRLGQLSESESLLTELLSRVQAVQPRTRESCLLEGSIQRLLSHLFSVTPGPRGLNSTHLAQESVRCHLSVVHHLIGKHLDESVGSKGASPVDRWLAVTELLTSLLHLGRTYLLIGYARGATCYLEEGLKLSQSLALPRWCASFLSELGRLSCVVGCFSDSKIYLQQVSEVLWSKEALTTFPNPQPEKEASARDSPVVGPSAQNKGCFGFESPSVDTDGEEFVLHTVPMTMRDRGMSEESEGDISSLSLVTEGCFDHPTDCVCDACSDIQAHRLNTSYLLSLTDYFLSAGQSNSAYTSVQLVLKVIDRFYPKLCLLLKPLCSAGGKQVLEKGRLQSLCDALTWLTLFNCKALLHLLRIQLLRGQFSEALTSAHQTEELLVRCKSGLGEVQHLLTEVRLCKAQVILTSTGCNQLYPGGQYVSRQSQPDVLTTPILTAKSLTQKFEVLTLESTTDNCSKSRKKNTSDSVFVPDSEEDTFTEQNEKLKPKHTEFEVLALESTSDNCSKSQKKNPSNSVFVPDSEDDSFTEHTEKLKPKKTRRTKVQRAERTVVEDSDIDDYASVKTANTLCDQLNSMSLAEDLVSGKSVAGTALKPKPTSRGRKQKVKDVNMGETYSKDRGDALSFSRENEAPNLKPKRTARGRKELDIYGLSDCSEKSGVSDDEKILKPKKTVLNTTLKPKRTIRSKKAGNQPEETDVVEEPSPLKPKKTTRGRKPKAVVDGTYPLPSDSEDTVKPSQQLKQKTTRGRKNQAENTENLLPKSSRRNNRANDDSNAQINPSSNHFDIDCPDPFEEREISAKKPLLPKKTTKRGSRRAVTDVEVGRATDLSLYQPVSMCQVDCLSRFSLCDSLQEDSFSAHAVSPVALTFSPVSDDQYSPTPVKRLDLSLGFQAADVSLNSSVELARAGNDEESALQTKLPRRKTCRKKSNRDGTEKELPRASRVCDISDRIREPCKNVKIVQRNPSPANTLVTATSREKKGVCPDVSSRELLESALKCLGPFPPTLLYRSVCQQLAAHYISDCPVKAANLLAESHGVTLRHRSLANSAHLIKQRQKSGQSSPAVSEGDHITAFGQETTIVQQTLDIMPHDWTVCMLSVVHSGCGQSDLVLTRLQRGQEPIVRAICPLTSDQMQGVLGEFGEVMEASRQSMKVTNKTEWWRTRNHLNQMLQDLLTRLETDVLGPWKCLLVGRASGEEAGALPTELLQSALGKVLLSSAGVLSEEELVEIVCELSQHSPGSVGHTELLAALRKEEGSADRKPLILVLDQALQHLPWESLPVLLGQPVCRVASLYQLHDLLTRDARLDHSPLRHGIDATSTYYVLNPDNNLPDTQQRFQDMFQQQPGWTGLTSETPNKEQFTAALTDHQLFVYCGHGAGSKYLHGDDLQYLSCSAAVLLMGCSSGRLQVDGRLEPVGMMHHYALAGCPCVVANLWDVTDKDIDRLTETLLNLWVVDRTNDCLATALAKSRSSCRLPFLIGCAPVLYGLPVKLGHIS